MGLKRTWKNKKARDYRYDVTEKFDLNKVRHPAGFHRYADGSGFYRVVAPQKKTAPQVEAQGYGQLKKIEVKITRAQNLLKRAKRSRLRKKYTNELRRLEQKQSNILEKIVAPEEFEKQRREVRKIIKTKMIAYLTGKFTDGTELSFRVEFTLSYTEGTEQSTILDIKDGLLEKVVDNGENLENLETLELEEVEAA